MADFAGDKTHEPTPRRRQKARDEGRVAHSHELGSAVLLVGSLVVLLLAGGALLEFLADLLRAYLSGGAWKSWIHTSDAGGRLAGGQFAAILAPLARLLLPVLAGATLLAVAAGLLQTGFLAWPRRVAPDVSRLNPLAGLRRLLWGGNAARLALGVSKIGVVVAVGAGDLWSRRAELAALAGLEIRQLAATTADVCLGTCLKIGAVLLALSVVDYLYQRWRLERELRMSSQEIRQELRELEGDPQIAARRRKLRDAAGRLPPVAR